MAEANALTEACFGEGWYWPRMKGYVMVQLVSMRNPTGDEMTSPLSNVVILIVLSEGIPKKSKVDAAAGETCLSRPGLLFDEISESCVSANVPFLTRRRLRPEGLTVAPTGSSRCAPTSLSLVIGLLLRPEGDCEANVSAMRRAWRHPQAPAVGFDD
jgi:hypothetical protein